MKILKKLSVLLLCMSVVLAAGCAKQNNEANNQDNAQQNPSKKYIIATDTTFAPFEFQDEQGNYVGVDIDILAAIAEDQNFEYDLQPLGFDAACAALEANQADGVIAGMSITDERKLKYDFSSAYYDSGVVVAVSEDSSIASYEDLKGKTLAVKTGTEGSEYAESIKDEYGLTIKYFDESPLMYQEVKIGGADACVEDYPVMGYGIKNGNGLKMVGDMVKGSSYGFAVSKDKNPELLRMFEDGLENIKSNGKYQEILDKYISEE